MVFQLIRWLDQRRDSLEIEDSIPHTAFYNTDLAYFVMGEEGLVEIKNIHEAPQYIYLKAKIVPIKQSLSLMTLTYEEEEKSYNPVLLYPPDFGDVYQYKAIELHYLGMGDYVMRTQGDYQSFTGGVLPWGELNLQSNLLYRHSFITQDHPVHVKGQPTIQEVRGYGGYYQPGCSLDEIQQVFFTSGFEDQNSAFYLSPLTLWRQKEIRPPLKGQEGEKEVYFLECGTELTMTLAEALQGGKSSFFLGDQKEKEGHGYEYRSMDVITMAYDHIIIGYKRSEG